MPMGNPLSPTIADIIMDELLEYTVDILSKNNVFIKFIVKYVDDIFAIIKRKIINYSKNALQLSQQITIHNRT